MRTFEAEPRPACSIPSTDDNPLCFGCQTLYDELKPYIQKPVAGPHTEPTNRRGSIRLTKLMRTIHPEEVSPQQYPFTWFLSTDFHEAPDDILVDRMGEHLLEELPYFTQANVRVHAALVENGHRATAHFMVDSSSGFIPEKKWFNGMWMRYLADFDSLEIYSGGSDPLRRRLLFFKAALDVDELNLEYDVN